jgi:hypothetical protein
MADELPADLVNLATQTFSEIARQLVDPERLKLRIEEAIYALANEFEEILPGSPLVLYPQNHGRGGPPFGLYWNMTRADSGGGSLFPFRRSLTSSDRGTVPRKLYYVGRLTKELIFQAGKWEMRERLWDFDRRAHALNDGRKVIVRARDGNLKALAYRLSRSPVILASSFPDRPEFEIPPFSEESHPPGGSSPNFHRALRVAWILAHGLSHADLEFRLLLERERNRPAHARVRLENPSQDLAPPDGGPVWLILPSSSVRHRLSHRILGRYGIPRTERADLLATEGIRRKIARNGRVARRVIALLRTRSENAILAFDRAMAAARVILPPGSALGPASG